MQAEQVKIMFNIWRKMQKQPIFAKMFNSPPNNSTWAKRCLLKSKIQYCQKRIIDYQCVGWEIYQVWWTSFHRLQVMLTLSSVNINWWNHALACGCPAGPERKVCCQGQQGQAGGKGSLWHSGQPGWAGSALSHRAGPVAAAKVSLSPRVCP